jgi:FAD/FMN-containing dehydrogenase
LIVSTKMKKPESWGRHFNYHHTSRSLGWRHESMDIPVSSLPYGLGRSYGDSCLNDQGVLLRSNQLDHFISFDDRKGLLCCEAGISLQAILELVVPRGWFLPVTPGTKFVTVAGAIANDVHGKNHNKVGTFGCHVRQFELLRSDGSRHVCSLQQKPELFAATIGGLGLTGFIVWAELQLIPVTNAFIEEESIQCRNLDEMMSLFQDSEKNYEYTVAWIDCLASGAQLGRGIFTRGNHCRNPALPNGFQPRPVRSVPFVFPPGCLNRLSVTAFNQLYYRKLGGKRKSTRMDYDRFFYPLDAIHHWNRLYGPGGFIQYQCVLVENSLEAMKELLQHIARSGQPSPLNVLKDFGDIPSPGLLSFPRKGLTLALDFPHRGEKTLQLCNALDEVVRQAKGALYPAKDSRMPTAMFESSFPRLAAFKHHIDPHFSSSFWRRVQPGQ